MDEVGIMEVGAAGGAEMLLLLGWGERGQRGVLMLQEGGMVIRTTVSKDLSPQRRF